MWRLIPFVAVLLIGCCAGCRPEKPGMDLSALVPREAAGWRASGEDQRYDRQSIFSYIDGAGEVYLQYSFRSVLVRGFERAGAPRIDVQLFDMERPEEAFGIFSFEREDEDAGVGRDSEYAAGLLRSWKGPYFVCVSAEEEARREGGGARAGGGAIARAIGEEGERPAMLAGLPQEGLLPNSVRWFHGPFCLAYHYPLPGGNLLGLGAGTEAALASYAPAGTAAGPAEGAAGPQGGAGAAPEGTVTGPVKVRVLLVRYRDDTTALAALQGFTRSYEPPLSGDGAALMKNGRWAGAGGTGRIVAAVFEAPSREEALRLLGEIAKRTEGASWAR